MGLMFGMEYMWLVLPAMALALYAQFKVKSTFGKYSKLGNTNGLSGAQVAEQLLQITGITDVRIEHVGGDLTDHYDPVQRVLRLSDSVYSSTSLSAVGVAAHETGHAVQHATGYAPLFLRSALVPATNVSSKLAMPLIFIGVLLGSQQGTDMGGIMIQAGILFFSMAVIFSFVTLPVEFNASSRAVRLLDEYGILSVEEQKPVRKVLNAAALTYVASAVVALMQLIRLILLFGRRRQ